MKKSTGRCMWLDFVLLNQLIGIVVWSLHIIWVRKIYIAQIFTQIILPVAFKVLKIITVDVDARFIKAMIVDTNRSILFGMIATILCP